MRKSIIGIAVATALAITSYARAAHFIAEPGLWRGSSKMESNGQSIPMKSRDRCVTAKEMDDEMKKLSQGPMHNTPEETCKKIKFEQTYSTIKWRVECTGKMQMDGDGSVVFDSASHYTGTVTMTGNMMGRPINNVIHLEGQRIGACTGNEKEGN